MIEIKDEIKKILFSKKIVILIVFLLFIIGLLFGSIYITVLSNDNKKVIMDSVSNYYESISNITFSDKLDIFKSSLINNSIYFLVMWLLGLSFIGLPIIFCMIFFKSFIIGFNIASIFANFKFKGIIYILIYIIPSNLLTLLLSIFLGIYSVNLSVKLVTNGFKKKTLNFDTFMGKYSFIILVIFLIIIICSLIDSFLSPALIKIFT